MRAPESLPERSFSWVEWRTIADGPINNETNYFLLLAFSTRNALRVRRQPRFKFVITVCQ